MTRRARGNAEVGGRGRFVGERSGWDPLFPPPRKIRGGQKARGWFFVGEKVFWRGAFAEGFCPPFLEVAGGKFVAFFRGLLTDTIGIFGGRFLRENGRTSRGILAENFAGAGSVFAGTVGAPWWPPRSFSPGRRAPGPGPGPRRSGAGPRSGPALVGSGPAVCRRGSYRTKRGSAEMVTPRGVAPE